MITCLFAIYRTSTNKERPGNPKDCHPFAELISQCWQHDPLHRPPFSEILEKLNQCNVDPFDGLPNEFFCPISWELMQNPVTTTSGHSYELNAVTSVLAYHPVDPISRQECDPTQLRPNLALQSLIGSVRNGTLQIRSLPS